MNREKANEILNLYGRPKVKVGDTNLIFARQTEEDLNEIESKTDEQLISHWKSLVFINDIVGQVSVNDLQRIALLDLEIRDRKTIDIEELKKWYETESENFDEEEFMK
jgi:hypothetical protein